MQLLKEDIMRFQNKPRRATTLLLFACATVAAAAVTGIIPNLRFFPDPTGSVATFNAAGPIDKSNAFFQDFGTNGRTCATCHQPDQAFSISRRGIQEVYERTHGRDPLFASIDGANCPTSDSNSRKAHSLLLQHGLIRVGMAVPANPQFTISVVHDPYGCAITFDAQTGQPVISVYRRPLATTNLRFLSTIMFDGRETVSPLNNAKTFSDNLTADLAHQALSAIQTHAQAAVQPTDQQLAEIVSFELNLSTAQAVDDRAGVLHNAKVNGGPVALSTQHYYPGINDSLGSDPQGATFNSSSFDLYKKWEGSNNEDKAHIAAGEKLFNTAPAIITDVRGLNDNPALNSPASITGTCTTCHDSPNVGNHSFPLPLDIATSRQPGNETNPAIIAGLEKLSSPDLPVYEIRGCTDPSHSGKPVVFYTSDPGKALVTGQCIDVNRGKGPILRGLAARAPYFHNGAAANLDELVDFYNQRFQMNLDNKEKRELIAFLNSL